MIINSNLTGGNTVNHLKRSTSNVSKSTEKLSSGLKINRAADDAAGLSISEKMRAQIRGLEQAQRNTQDGISLVQTAEAGMTEIHSILQRVRELAVQSANDTNTDADRVHLQSEVNELLKEVDAIANQTEFNGMALLAGRVNQDGKEVQGLSDFVNYVTSSNGINDIYTLNGQDYASAMIDFSNINSAADIAHLEGEGFHYTCATCSKAYSVKFVNGTPDTSRLNDYNPVMEVDISNITNGEDLVKSILETAYGELNFVYEPDNQVNPPDPANPPTPNNATEFVKHFSQLAADGGKIFLFDYRPQYAGDTWPTSDGRGVFKPIVYNDVKEDLFLPLKIQNGSNEGNYLELKIPNVTLERLSIEHLLVATQIEADFSISRVDQAINKLSMARSAMGTYQNRLEHSLQHVSNYEVNLTDAKSRLTDTDMAKELMEMTKNNLLTQSAQVLLSQSNQQQQAVLKLLQ